MTGETDEQLVERITARVVAQLSGNPTSQIKAPLDVRASATARNSEIMDAITFWAARLSELEGDRAALAFLRDLTAEIEDSRRDAALR